MTRILHPDTTLTVRASAMLRGSTALENYRLLFVGYPPAKGAISRVTACLGEEIIMPDGVSLLTHGFNESRAILAGAERNPGTNTHGYLKLAAQAILVPVSFAYRLSVTTPDGARWRPDVEDDWNTWRKDHPGALSVALEDEAARTPARAALEDRLLGKLFLLKLQGVPPQSEADLMGEGF
ncbi:MAG: hypothetical protein L0H19_04955 [Salinisphaera sp.]|nr:hypothetical protein [Salinisphaera sp.]